MPSGREVCKRAKGWTVRDEKDKKRSWKLAGKVVKEIGLQRRATEYVVYANAGRLEVRRSMLCIMDGKRRKKSYTAREQIFASRVTSFSEPYSGW